MKIAHSVNIRVLFNDSEETEDDMLNLLSIFFPNKIKQIFEANEILNLDKNNKSNNNLIEELNKEKFKIEITNFQSKDALKNNYRNLKLHESTDLKMIEIIELKETLINEILNNIKEKLGEEQNKIIVSQDDRVDEDCNLFIRLDKDKIKENQFILTESGNCVHFKIKLASYPNKKTNALKLVKGFFSN